jgi:serine/alanine adding enzyme
MIQSGRELLNKRYSFLNSALEINATDWRDFVHSHPHGNVFYTPEMVELHSNSKNYEPIFIALLNPEQKINGLLIAFIYKEYKGLVGKFTARAIISGGPLTIDNEVGIADLLLTGLDKICNEKVVFSQFRNLWDNRCFKSVFNKKGYQYEDHLNFLFDLSKGEEFIWNKIHPTRKKQINRSIKRDVHTKVIDDLTHDELDTCFTILKLVYKAAKLPYPDQEFFKKAFQILGKSGYLKTILATFRGEIIGFRFFLSYHGLLYDWYAGSLPEHHDKYPNDLLPWELMKWGVLNGYNTFDFGGAGKPGVPYGVRDYKMKFGGEMVNYGRYEKVHKPVIMMLAKVGFKVWRLLK